MSQGHIIAAKIRVINAGSPGVLVDQAADRSDRHVLAVLRADEKRRAGSVRQLHPAIWIAPEKLVDPRLEHPVNKAIERTREAAKGEDAEKIKSAVNELEQASHALSKTLYASAGAQPDAADATADAAAGEDASAGDDDGGGDDGGDDDTIDAEFEVKDS